jgi:hypothetical protein
MSTSAVLANVFWLTPPTLDVRVIHGHCMLGHIQVLFPATGFFIDTI